MKSLTTEPLYTPRFFQAFGAFTLFMTGVSLQFHFGQYLEYLGHEVDTLGWVLSISTFGALTIRLFVGGWIDRFGCRPTWLIGSVGFALAIGAVQITESLWLIILLRTLSAMAAAAVMTTIAVFAAQIAPPRRRAESIGSIGLAGFLGMTLGPALGDYFFAGQTDVIGPYRVFFSASALCSLLAAAVMSARNVSPSDGHAFWKSPANSLQPTGFRETLRIVSSHWPGWILLIGVVCTMVFCLQTLFLERLAEERGFHDIKVFFLVYCPTAIVLRIIFRRLPERIGRARTLLMGMTLMAGGLLCMIGLQAQHELILPGFVMGAGHCFMFPSMVDLAAARLPPEYRGTGTALILGAGDVGMLVGFAALGELIEARGFDAALIALALALTVGATVFAVTRKVWN